MNSPRDVVPDTIHVIVGEMHAVVLSYRQARDYHVCFTILSEDDTNWFVSNACPSASSYWLPELAELVKEAELWVKKNCDPEPDGYGWVFRK